MYVLSQVTLRLKKGTGEHSDKVFVNKGSKAKPGVENSAEGMAILAKAIKAGKLGSRSVYMIGQGQMPLSEVLPRMESGEVLAYQYHREGHAEPKWQINLGFAEDVEAKNAEYAAKKAGSRPKAKAASKAPKNTGLID